jgi:hypothetical protein
MSAGAKKAGFTDTAAGAGVLEALVTEPQGLTTLLQGVDLLLGGDPFYLKTVSGSVTPPTMQGTTPGWQALAYRVPAGKFAVIDAISLLCAVADESYARIARRYLMAGNCATAAPAAPAAPAVAVVTHDQGIDEANGSNGFSYKITQINALGQESTASAASSTVTPSAAQRAIDVTLPALATGAVAIGVYRSLAGAPGGPWYHLVNADGGAAFRDTRPDVNLDQTKQPPAASWGNAYAPLTLDAPVELVYACLNALAVAPARLVYLDEQGYSDNVAFAPAIAAGTHLRIPLAGETKGWASPATPAGFQLQDARSTDYGARGVRGFNNTFANAGGQWIIWGLQVLGETHFEGAIPIAGGRVLQKLARPAVFPAGSTIVVEAGGQAAQAAGVRELQVFGRIYDTPS